MESKETKMLNRYYIQNTIKNRSYIGYKVDIEIIKIICAILAFWMTISLIDSAIIAFLLGVQAYAIMTLIMDYYIKKKIAVGRSICQEKLMKKFFSDKIFLSNNDEFDYFIKLYLNFNRYRNVKKIGKYRYASKKNGNTYIFTVFKYYEGAWIDKIDIRKFISYVRKVQEKCILIVLNDLTDEAKETIEKYWNIDNVICYKDLFDFAVDYGLLPVNKINQISIIEHKTKHNIKKLMDNILLDNKIIIYSLAAIGFNFLYIIMGRKKLFIYFATYFVIISILCTFWGIIKSIKKKNIDI